MDARTGGAVCPGWSVPVLPSGGRRSSAAPPPFQLCPPCCRLPICRVDLIRHRQPRQKRRPRRDRLLEWISRETFALSLQVPGQIPGLSPAKPVPSRSEEITSGRRPQCANAAAKRGQTGRRMLAAIMFSERCWSLWTHRSGRAGGASVGAGCVGSSCAVSLGSAPGSGSSQTALRESQRIASCRASLRREGAAAQRAARRPTSRQAFRRTRRSRSAPVWAAHCHRSQPGKKRSAK